MCVLSAKKQCERINIWLQLSEKEICRRFFQQSMFIGHKHQKTQHTDMCRTPCRISHFPPFLVSRFLHCGYASRRLSETPFLPWEAFLYSSGVVVYTSHQKGNVKGGNTSNLCRWTLSVLLCMHLFVYRKLCRVRTLQKGQPVVKNLRVPKGRQRETQNMLITAYTFNWS